MAGIPDQVTSEPAGTGTLGNILTQTVIAAPLEQAGSSGRSDGRSQVMPPPGIALAKPDVAVRRIAILGTAPSTRDQAPFHDPTFLGEFWSLNDAWQVFPVKEGWTWFDLHPREWYTGPNRPPNHLEWLRQSKVPIYMWQTFPDIPASIPYPFDEMCRLFPGATARWSQGPQGAKLEKDRGYLTSSIAEMLALAISQMKAGDEIWLWGVDLAADTEYFRQRSGTEYLLGVAQGRGIKIVLPDACPLLKGPFYGRSDAQDAADEKARQFLEMLWQRTLQEKHKKEAEVLFLKGKSQAFEEMRAKWPSR